MEAWRLKPPQVAFPKSQVTHAYSMSMPSLGAFVHPFHGSDSSCVEVRSLFRCLHNPVPPCQPPRHFNGRPRQPRLSTTKRPSDAATRRNFTLLRRRRLASALANVFDLIPVPRHRQRPLTPSVYQAAQDDSGAQPMSSGLLGSMLVCNPYLHGLPYVVLGRTKYRTVRPLPDTLAPPIPREGELAFQLRHCSSQILQRTMKFLIQLNQLHATPITSRD